MKRWKNLKVSWAPGPKLCQVKMFRAEDCPAKVASQPQRHNYPKQSSLKPRGPDLPPGFEGNHYADNKIISVSNIHRIQWKRPLKFIVNDTWLVGCGGESTESQTENLRIVKVLEAIYPHRSAIPSRPSVSPAVEAECFDDNKTPVIRLTPIEDEWESTEELSRNTANKQGQLETKPSCTIQEPVSGLAPDLSLAASVALTALRKTKEEGSMVDPDLLIKFLTDPKMIKNLINDKTGKVSKTENHSIDININPTRLVPQQFTTLSMARKPQPLIIPQEQSFAASQPFTNPELGNGNISQLNKINRNPVNISITEQPSLRAWLPSNTLPMNLNHQRPQPQLQPNSTFQTSEMNNAQATFGFGRGSQTGFDTYPMNLNRVDTTRRPRPRPVVEPMKSLDYFKNLIKEHGSDHNHETNQNHSQNGIFNERVNNNKVQKQCIYFGNGRGCKLGESCIYVHDRFTPNFDQSAKRLKLERYDKYGL